MFKTVLSKTKGHPDHNKSTKTKAYDVQKGASLLFLTIAIVGSLHILVMLGIETRRYFRTSHAIANLQVKIAIDQATLLELREIEAHKYDDRYREQLARKQGFIYPNEQRYVTINNYENLEYLVIP